MKGAFGLKSCGKVVARNTILGRLGPSHADLADL
jgi:hypothetical protein